MGGNNEQDTISILKKFYALPKLYQGKEVIVSFEIEREFSSCLNPEVFSLPLGATVDCIDVEVQPSGKHFAIYAKDELVKKALDMPVGAKVTAKVKTVFGIEKEAEFTDEGPIVTRRVHDGLLVVEFVNVQPQADT